MDTALRMTNMSRLWRIVAVNFNKISPRKNNQNVNSR